MVAGVIRIDRTVNGRVSSAEAYGTLPAHGPQRDEQPAGTPPLYRLGADYGGAALRRALVVGMVLHTLFNLADLIFLLLHLTAVLRALGHAKTATALLVSRNALNILVFLIYGDGPAPEVFAWGAPIAHALGIPRLEVVGAAYATILARTAPVVVGFVLLVRRRGGPRFHRLSLRPNPAVLWAILRIGWPASLQLVLRAKHAGYVAAA